MDCLITNPTTGADVTNSKPMETNKMDSNLVCQSLQHHGTPLLRWMEVEQREHFPQIVIDRAYRQEFASTKVSEIGNPAFQVRLTQFIARKADLLFKSTDEEKKENQSLSSDDMYGIMPPIEFFMGIPYQSCRRQFFKSIKKRDILIGVVTTVMESGLLIDLLCMDNQKVRDLDSLKITAFCPSKELPTFRQKINPAENFQVQDVVKGVVMLANAESEKVILSLHSRHLEGCSHSDMTLGLITEEQFPVHYKRKLQVKGLGFEELLQSILGFNNSGNVNFLNEHHGLSDTESYMRGLHSLKIPEREYAENVRKLQSARKAHQSVLQGVTMFKQGKYLEAMQYLNHALKIDDKNVEGLVARGALYANNECYCRAIEDFDEALKENPRHVNAITYLVETLLAKAKQQEDQAEWKLAEETYQRVLTINPTHPEASESIKFVIYKKNHVRAVSPTIETLTETDDIVSRFKDLIEERKPREVSGGRSGRRSRSYSPGSRSRERKRSPGRRKSSYYRKGSRSPDSRYSRHRSRNRSRSRSWHRSRSKSTERDKRRSSKIGRSYQQSPNNKRHNTVSPNSKEIENKSKSRIRSKSPFKTNNKDNIIKKERESKKQSKAKDINTLTPETKTYKSPSPLVTNSSIPKTSPKLESPKKKTRVISPEKDTELSSPEWGERKTPTAFQDSKGRASSFDEDEYLYGDSSIGYEKEMYKAFPGFRDENSQIDNILHKKNVNMSQLFPVNLNRQFDGQDKKKQLPSPEPKNSAKAKTTESETSHNAMRETLKLKTFNDEINVPKVKSQYDKEKSWSFDVEKEKTKTKSSPKDEEKLDMDAGRKPRNDSLSPFEDKVTPKKRQKSDSSDKDTSSRHSIDSKSIKQENKGHRWDESPKSHEKNVKLKQIEQEDVHMERRISVKETKSGEVHMAVQKERGFAGDTTIFHPDMPHEDPDIFGGTITRTIYRSAIKTDIRPTQIVEPTKSKSNFFLPRQIIISKMVDEKVTDPEPDPKRPSGRDDRSQDEECRSICHSKSRSRSYDRQKKTDRSRDRSQSTDRKQSCNNRSKSRQHNKRQSQSMSKRCRSRSDSKSQDDIRSKHKGKKSRLDRSRSRSRDNKKKNKKRDNCKDRRLKGRQERSTSRVPRHRDDRSTSRGRRGKDDMNWKKGDRNRERSRSLDHRHRDRSEDRGYKCDRQSDTKTRKRRSDHKSRSIEKHRNKDEPNVLNNDRNNSPEHKQKTRRAERSLSKDLKKKVCLDKNKSSEYKQRWQSHSRSGSEGRGINKRSESRDRRRGRRRRDVENKRKQSSRSKSHSPKGSSDRNQNHRSCSYDRNQNRRSHSYDRNKNRRSHSHERNRESYSPNRNQNRKIISKSKETDTSRISRRKSRVDHRVSRGRNLSEEQVLDRSRSRESKHKKKKRASQRKFDSPSPGRSQDVWKSADKMSRQTGRSCDQQRDRTNSKSPDHYRHQSRSLSRNRNSNKKGICPDSKHRKSIGAKKSKTKASSKDDRTEPQSSSDNTVKKDDKKKVTPEDAKQIKSTDQWKPIKDSLEKTCQQLPHVVSMNHNIDTSPIEKSIPDKQKFSDINPGPSQFNPVSKKRKRSSSTSSDSSSSSTSSTSSSSSDKKHKKIFDTKTKTSLPAIKSKWDASPKTSRWDPPRPKHQRVAHYSNSSSTKTLSQLETFLLELKQKKKQGEETTPTKL